MRADAREDWHRSLVAATLQSPATDDEKRQVRNEDRMSRTPKPDAQRARGAVLPPVEPADYSDELTKAQIAALRRYAAQDETKMGPLVHEFTW